jgi:hypothetical protein
VTIHSIRNHTARHFPVQQADRPAYRETLERRAKQNGVDFLEGVVTAITSVAFFETMGNSFLPPDLKPHSRTRTLAARRLAEAGAAPYVTLVDGRCLPAWRRCRRRGWVDCTGVRIDSMPS